MHPGLRIKVARVAKGLTQEELAEKIGRTRSLISGIEKTGKVNHYTLVAICNVLDLDPDDLSDISLQDPEDAPHSELATLRSENKLLRQEIQALKELVASQRSVIRLLGGDEKTS